MMTGSRIRARALLTPVSKGQQVLRMTYRSLSIGTGNEVDLCLSDYGFCNNISAQHAHIFYDEVSPSLFTCMYHEQWRSVESLSNKLSALVVTNEIYSMILIHHFTIIITYCKVVCRYYVINSK